MKTIQLLGLLLVLNLSFVLHAQSKTFEIIPQFPKPGEQFTISYIPTSTPLKDATNISGIMYIYDDFRWIIKDFSLSKTKVGTWETREQLSSQAALIACVFNSGSVIDYGEEEPYAMMIEDSPGVFLGWGMLLSAIFQKEIPIKVENKSFVQDSIVLSWVKKELNFHPESSNRTVYERLLLRKEMDSESFDNWAKKELRTILNTPLDKRMQYSIQKSLKLLDAGTQKTFIDSVQKVLVKTYPKGVLARDLVFKKIAAEPNMVLKSKLYFDFVSNFPKSDFKDVCTEAEHLYNDQIYKSIINYSIKKDNDISILMNSLKELSYSNLIDFSRNLISIPFTNKKTSVEILNVYASSLIPEIAARSLYVPKEYREKLSVSEWRKLALQNAAAEYFTYAKILEKLQNFKESQRLLEKIKSEFGFKNAAFNEMFYRILIRNGKKEEAKSFFELCANENNVTPKMSEIATKIF